MKGEISWETFFVKNKMSSEHTKQAHIYTACKGSQQGVCALAAFTFCKCRVIFENTKQTHNTFYNITHNKLHHPMPPKNIIYKMIMSISEKS